MLFYFNSHELAFIGKKGITYGWENVMSNYKNNYGNKQLMGNLFFDIKKIHVVNNKNALVTGAWRVINSRGEVGGYFTLWFKKIKRKWFIVLDHTS